MEQNKQNLKFGSSSSSSFISVDDDINGLKAIVSRSTLEGIKELLASTKRQANNKDLPKLKEFFFNFFENIEELPKMAPEIARDLIDRLLDYSLKYPSPMGIRSLKILYKYLINPQRKPNNQIIANEFQYNPKNIQKMSIKTMLQDRNYKDFAIEFVLYFLNTNNESHVFHFTENADLIECINWADRRQKNIIFEEVYVNNIEFAEKVKEFNEITAKLKNFEESFDKKIDLLVTQKMEEKITNSTSVQNLYQAHRELNEDIDKLDLALATLDEKIEILGQGQEELKKSIHEGDDNIRSVYDELKGLNSGFKSLEIEVNEINEKLTKIQTKASILAPEVKSQEDGNVTGVQNIIKQDEIDKLLENFVSQAQRNRDILEIKGISKELQEIQENFKHNQSNFQEEIKKIHEGLKNTTLFSQITVKDNVIENKVDDSQSKKISEKSKNLLSKQELNSSLITIQNTIGTHQKAVDEFRIKIQEALSKVNSNFSRQASFNEKVEDYVNNITEMLEKLKVVELEGRVRFLEDASKNGEAKVSDSKNGGVVRSDSNNIDLTYYDKKIAIIETELKAINTLKQQSNAIFEMQKQILENEEVLNLVAEKVLQESDADLKKGEKSKQNGEQFHNAIRDKLQELENRLTKFENARGKESQVDKLSAVLDSKLSDSFMMAEHGFSTQSSDDILSFIDKFILDKKQGIEDRHVILAQLIKEDSKDMNSKLGTQKLINSLLARLKILKSSSDNKLLLGLVYLVLLGLPKVVEGVHLDELILALDRLEKDKKMQEVLELVSLALSSLKNKLNFENKENLVLQAPVLNQIYENPFGETLNYADNSKKIQNLIVSILGEQKPPNPDVKIPEKKQNLPFEIQVNKSNEKFESNQLTKKIEPPAEAKKKTSTPKLC